MSRQNKFSYENLLYYYYYFKSLHQLFSLGIFAEEFSTFLDMLESIGLDKNHQMYCVRKMMTIAIRTTYYIFCCRNKEWENPDLLTI
jgi:hypothetical protein